MLTAGAAAVLLLTACGGSDDGPGVASLGDEAEDDGGEAASEEEEATTEEELMEWVDCMREEGVDLPDPQVDEDGNPVIVMERGGSASMQDASEARGVCGPNPGMGAGSSGMDPSEMQDRALELAQCMRDNGYDMPDPDFGEGGGVIFGGGEVDADDPAFQDAMEQCDDIMGDRSGGRLSGPGSEDGG